jgi:hypothetical protein
MMVIPINPDVNETEHVAHEHRPQRQQGLEIGAMRDFEFQHHDGDDDGNNAVAEGFQSIFSHISYFPAIDLASTESCSIPSKVEGSLSSELTIPENIKASNLERASAFFSFISFE